MENIYSLTQRRKKRTRLKLSSAKKQRPRLSIFRSGRHIYAQVINDTQGNTIASASTLEKAHREKFSSCSDIKAAAEIGKIVAERALSNGVVDVAFDRGSFKYHGRVKALAESAREAGLNF